MINPIEKLTDYDERGQLVDPEGRSNEDFLNLLTEEELNSLRLQQSTRWCGTDEEGQDRGYIIRLLQQRTPAKKPLLKKIFPFL